MCNTGGPGIEYHPISGESTAAIKYKMSLVIDDIPAYRVSDSAFWFMLFRMMVINQFHSNNQFFIFAGL